MTPRRLRASPALTQGAAGVEIEIDLADKGRIRHCTAFMDAEQARAFAADLLACAELSEDACAAQAQADASPTGFARYGH